MTKFVSDLQTGRWFSPGPPVPSTNKTDRHDITEILLTVALNAIKQNKQSTLLRQGFLKNPLIVYFKTFFGRYQYLVEKSSVTYVQMTKDGIDNYIFVQR